MMKKVCKVLAREEGTKEIFDIDNYFIVKQSQNKCSQSDRKAADQSFLITGKVHHLVWLNNFKKEAVGNEI
jgi:hypothetical protein